MSKSDPTKKGVNRSPKRGPALAEVFRIFNANVYWTFFVGSLLDPRHLCSYTYKSKKKIFKKYNFRKLEPGPYFSRKSKKIPFFYKKDPRHKMR